jgi:hypothetical protein
MPEEEILKVERGQTDDKIRALHRRFKGHPKIRWKDSNKEAVG